MVGYQVHSSWGIPPQYHFPQKVPDKNYWDTKLTDNGLGLENMIRFVSNGL